MGGTTWDTLGCSTLPTPRGTHLRDASPREGHNHSHHVDCQLELQELGYAVIDVAAPHHCLDDAAEVVIRQDDV